MDIVFLKDIKGVAVKGDVKSVAHGYFRNYLLPKKLARRASETDHKMLEERRKNEVIKKERLEKEAKEVKTLLEANTYEIKSKVSNKNKLYGSITEADIAEVIKKHSNVEVEKGNVKLKGHIKELGEYDVPVKLSETVTASVKVNIIANE